MPPLAIIDFDVQELEMRLGEIGARADAFPLSVLSEMLSNAVNDEIETEGRARWVPFAESTLVRHPRRVGGSLLQDTGLLANIQPDEGDDWVEASSPARYAIFHVVGTRNMPKRDFLDIDIDGFLREAAEVYLHSVVP